MVQREGRILRQGNRIEEVQIFRYITKGSFDAYSWQLLETKQRFISQLLSGSITERQGGDVDDAVLNYAEVKALAVGDPLIKRRWEVINEMDKLKVLRKEYLKGREMLIEEKAAIPEKVGHEKELIKLCEQDKEHYEKSKREYKYEEARALQLKALPLVKQLFIEVNPIPVKAALNMQGFNVGSPRLPLTEMTDAHKQTLRQAMIDFGCL